MKPFIMAIFGLLALLALSMYPRRGSGFGMSFKRAFREAMPAQQPQYVGPYGPPLKRLIKQDEVSRQMQIAAEAAALQAKKQAVMQRMAELEMQQQRKFGFSKRARRV